MICLQHQNKYKIEDISAAAENEISESNLLIYAIGYEDRSNYIRSLFSSNVNCIGINYESSGLADFDKNLELARLRKDTISPINSQRSIRDNIADIIKYFQNQREFINITIDVSCLDRTLMASVMISVIGILRTDDKITFLYTSAEFREPSLYLTPLKHFGPASYDLAGRIGDPYRQRVLLMGLGYEYGASLHVLNMIEPNYTHIFYPEGEEKKYIPFVKKANFNFDFGLNKFDLSKYDIMNPVLLHGKIRDLVYSFRHNSTIMIVPFGPKIFSAVSIIVAINNKEDVSLMRYSVESIDYFPETKASGVISGFSYLRLN